MDEFSRFNVQSDPEKAILELLGDNVPESVKKEFKLLSASLDQKYKGTELKYPLSHRIEDSTSFFLYSFVRLYQPSKIVETGVANGHSSFFILNALNENGKGELYSIDVSPDVGPLITEELKKNWKLLILSKPNKKNLEEKLERIYPFDIFIHDSNHFYYWQELEYELALKYIKKDGLIMSDDIDASYAFFDFCIKNELDPLYIYDVRKVFGITRKR